MKLALAWIDLADPTDRAVAMGLARRLEALGHRVMIVGPRRRFSEPSSEERGGIPVRRVGSPALAACPPLEQAWAALELLGLHRRERPDVWHCHVFARRHEALSWAAALGRWPIMASLHLVLPDYLASAGGLRGLRALLRRAFHVTAVSETSLAEARRLFPEIQERSSVVWNGIPAPEPGEEPGDAALPAGPYALCASRLAPYKGLDILLMSFARLRDQGHDLRLVLCGRDQLDGGLDRFARALGLGDAVLFAGNLPPARLKRLLDGCLFFALASRRENLPLALLEAMAAGKPVVATRAGGVPEIVTDGEDGLLVEPENVEALAAAMAALASDAGLRERLGRRALERSRCFDWSRAARAYAELYASA